MKAPANPIIAPLKDTSGPNFANNIKTLVQIKYPIIYILTVFWYC